MSYSISEEKIEEITGLTDIVDIIGEHLSLKKTGANYIALCPFHKEKTPSFSVSPDKQIYHCFGCGESGDAISFLMKYDNLDFLEAVEHLADRAGVLLDMSKEKVKPDNDFLKVNYKINREAAIFFHKNLMNSPNAIKYFENRGIQKKAQKYFGLGYIPNQWHDLLNHLKKLGFEEKEIEETGLAIKSENKGNYYDRFRNRIIFPIFDLKKRVIGFGGRVLDDTLPKYINSPDSIIFNKGRNLYNLNNARNYTDKGIILTEGYMDVIKLTINGYNNVVASLGTALTDNQVKLMKKYSREFYISYDSDNAGLKAAIKAVNVLKSHDLNSKVIIFPEKMDPDDFVTKYGGARFNDRLNKALEYFDYLDYYLNLTHDTRQDKGKLGYIKEINLYLQHVKNAVEKELYIEKISQKLGISKESILLEFKNNQRKAFNRTPDSIKKLDMAGQNASDYELDLIEILTNNHEMTKYIKNKYDTSVFYSTKNRSRFYAILNDLSKEHTDEQGTYKRMDLTQDELKKVVDDYIKKIKTDQLIKIKSEIKTKLLTEPENTQFKEQISEIDKEILRLRGHHNG
ncbi:MAG: DNA primase [Clostridiales bacterium 38_11]|nr:MAG: DNA primase [Clostridiales bacterium 38_11]HBH13477.1 DNA primase [Clostridiales bacterium]